MGKKGKNGTAKPNVDSSAKGVQRSIQKFQGVGKGTLTNAAAVKGSGNLAKGKGPNKGKSVVKAEEIEEVAEAEERPLPPPPDKAARERIFTTRITGKLIRWRAHVGWIRPAEKFDHPEFQRHKKGLYVHEVDVQPGHTLYQGAQVTFFVYCDADGLGAEHVMLAKEQGVVEDKPNAKAKGNSKGKGKAAGKDATGSNKTMIQKTKLKKKGKQGGDGEKTKSGPDLPRERITTIAVIGKVVEWKGKFGWLSCSEEIEHEKASKHDGKIYVHEKDILAGAPLSSGQLVGFHVYADESGLGAEEVIATS